MRIIHVDTGAQWRGGQSQVLLLAQGLMNYDCNTIVVAKKGGPLAERARKQGVNCVELPFRFEGDVLSARKLHLIASESKDRNTLFHAHTPHALGQILLAQRPGARHPIVFSRRVSFPLKKWAITRWKLNQAQRIIAVSRSVAGELQKGGIQPEKIRVIYSAVDTKQFEYSGPSLAETRSIAVLGATEFDKGIKEAMEFAQRSSALPVVFHFLGGGRDLATLKSFASNRKNVVVHGFVSNVETVFSGMYAAISFSHIEGFPNMVLQAMAKGLPVLGLENAALRELMSGENVGWMFRTLDEAFDRLKAILNDAKTAADAGKRGSRMVRERFSTERMVEQTYLLYKEISS